jgi:hypothetical protein
LDLSFGDAELFGKVSLAPAVGDAGLDQQRVQFLEGVSLGGGDGSGGQVVVHLEFGPLKQAADAGLTKFGVL